MRAQSKPLLQHQLFPSLPWLWGIGAVILLLAFFSRSAVWGQSICDTRGTIPIDPTSLTVTEGGPSATYGVSLCKQPRDSVTVTLVYTPTAQLIVNSTILTFTQDDWSIPQSIIVTAIDDKILEGTQIVSITHEAKSNDPQYNGGSENSPKVNVTINDPPHLLLPLIVKMPQSIATPVPTPQWQLLGNSGSLNANTVAINHSDSRIFTGEKSGIYAYGTAGQGCSLALSWQKKGPDLQVLSLAFSAMHGVAGTLANKIFYSSDGGNIWDHTNSTMDANVYATLFIANNAYAGTDNGVYKSTDSGVSWSLLPVNNLKFINALGYEEPKNTLWITTDTNGVWKLNLSNTQQFQQLQSGLTGEAIHVWDWARTADQKYYLATSDGIYQGDGNSAWVKANGNLPGELQNKPIYSLEVVNSIIYIGVKGGGVWQRSLSTTGDLLPNWSPAAQSGGLASTSIVRDLLYDGTICKGLLAATDQGVWVLR